MRKSLRFNENSILNKILKHLVGFYESDVNRQNFINLYPTEAKVLEEMGLIETKFVKIRQMRTNYSLTEKGKNIYMLVMKDCKVNYESIKVITRYNLLIDFNDFYKRD